MLIQKRGPTKFSNFFSMSIFLAKGGPWPNAPLNTPLSKYVSNFVSQVIGFQQMYSLRQWDHNVYTYDIVERWVPERPELSSRIVRSRQLDILWSVRSSLAPAAEDRWCRCREQF